MPEALGRPGEPTKVLSAAAAAGKSSAHYALAEVTSYPMDGFGVTFGVITIFTAKAPLERIRAEFTSETVREIDPSQVAKSAKRMKRGGGELETTFFANVIGYDEPTDGRGVLLASFAILQASGSKQTADDGPSYSGAQVIYRQELVGEQAATDGPYLAYATQVLPSHFRITEDLQQLRTRSEPRYRAGELVFRGWGWPYLLTPGEEYPSGAVKWDMCEPQDDRNPGPAALAGIELCQDLVNPGSDTPNRERAEHQLAEVMRTHSLLLA